MPGSPDLGHAGRKPASQKLHMRLLRVIQLRDGKVERDERIK
jgi:hypothetical protein